MRPLNKVKGGPFKAFLVDPPWEYDRPRALVGNGGKGKEGADKIVQVNVDNHYPTLSLQEIKLLPVNDIAEKNSFLFLYTTNVFLANGSATEVARSWGFKPVTVLTWAKVRADEKTPSMKNGHWFRSASEHIIFATRGKGLRRPEDYPALPTWQPSRRLPHSVKPEVFADYVETVAPDGPWLEMFARRRRKGWTVWGNEVPS